MSEPRTEPDPSERPVVPPMVYVPCLALPEDGQVQVVFRRMLDGRTALVLYTALDRLVDLCGPHQPWIVMPSAKLGDLNEVHPYDVIFLDLEMPEDQREQPPA